MFSHNWVDGWTEYTYIVQSKLMLKDMNKKDWIDIPPPTIWTNMLIGLGILLFYMSGNLKGTNYIIL